MEDAGGKLISIPVTYFNGNNSVGWKSYFQNPILTYLVSIVVISDFNTARHEVSFLGAPPDNDSPVRIDQKVYMKMRNLWVQHGSREIPSYELKTVFDKDAEAYDFRAPGKKKKKPKGKHLCIDIVRPLSFAMHVILYSHHVPYAVLCVLYRRSRQ